MGNYFSTTSKNLEDIDVHGTMRRLVKKNVTLLNYYKEVPVSYSAKVMDYDKDGVATLACHPVQVRLIDFDRYTIVRQGNFSFKANFVGLREQSPNNPNQQEILLSRFLPAEVYTDKRELVRVTYDIPIDVKISSGRFEFTAQMVDSSATSFRTKPVSDLPMDVRAKAQARFILPLRGAPLPIEAEVTLVRSTSEMQVYRMDISRAVESTVMRYINQRQLEIIKELNLEE